ncbi:penicillin amidase [Sphingopyxis panaciterrae]|uniref:penicillin acylase family protein n=1 Tax=Sphingopyxis panaciterrae TaxID=363841 RepID=UPI0014201275|nr:penicillin acylase family protein [Sphingopyxis panaciterrae]NIJ39510.1 penicillin amidase [Sphingopyxis panaciterrae]
MIRHLIAIVGAPILAAGTPAFARAPAADVVSTAASSDDWTVAGLDQPAEIVVDRSGLAHIYAANERDAFFLQGYNAARDRLWQIDVWRKRGLGQLAENFGAAYVRQDRAARLFLYRGDMAAEWSRYPPGTKKSYEAFAAGINAYVDAVQAGDRPLPVEFGLTQSRPARWTADEIVRIRSNALVSNVRQEVLRAQTLCQGGAAAERVRRRLYPDRAPVVPTGLDPCSIPADVLADYNLATGDVAFPAPAAKAGTANADPVDGSNAWVIAPSRTATGRPILANDPHRAFAVPSLRYVVHLDAPGLSLIGAGEPSLPGVALGHNGEAAFGLTIFSTDQEDLYAYELKPGDPDSYRYRGGWEKMRSVDETIAVKGGAPVTATLRFTRHGPLLWHDDQGLRAFALRTVWNSPGAAAYASAMWLSDARGWADFQRARAHWGTPPLNLMWADRSGTVGWSAAGIVPVRRNWDGLLPVPGDGRYEWEGFLPPERLPSSRNPENGWFATANEYNIPAGHPASPPIGYDWPDRSRFDRITDVLKANPRMAIDDVVRLQMDQHSAMAPRLIALAAAIEPRSDDARRALDRLRAWDFNVASESVAASIYEVWLGRHLGPALIGRVVPEAARKLLDTGSPDATLAVLERRDPLLGDAPDALIAAVLAESLEAALADLRTRLGPDMDEWQWGRLHRLTIDHALAARAGPDLAAQMRVGPVAVGGSGTTPAMTLYRDGSLAAIHGPSVRLVIDVGDWDRSLFLNMPGQSGDPADPHYRDLVTGWKDGAFRPLPFSRDAVMKEAERVIRLKPRG